MKQLNNRRLTALLVATLASCTLLVLADDPKTSAGASSPQVGNCKPSAVSATDAHQQLVALSSMIDPSGKLTKIINDYHPEPSASGHSHSHGVDPMQVAASEIEPVKRAADEEQAAAPATSASNSTTIATVQDAIKALVTAAATESNATSSTPAPVIVVKSDQATPASSTNASASTPAPKIAETTAASNVTVNVFLQVAPDSKADDLINNPDKAIASTTEAPPASSNLSTSSVEFATPSTNSTAAPTPAPVALNSTAQASAPASSVSQQQPAATASAKPSQTRRRRRWANPAAAPAPATQAPAPAPAPKASPSSTTSTTTTTTSTTTTTTTTTTPAPSSTTTTTTTAAPSTTSSTTAPRTTTTTTTAAAPPATSATTPKPKASVSTTVPTVELSTKDLAMAASNERSAPNKMTETPIEIVVSSVASTPAAAASASTSTTTSTTTSTAPSTTTSTTVRPSEAPTSPAPSTTTTTSTTTSTTPRPTAPAASVAPKVAAVVAPAPSPVEAAPPAPSGAAAASPPNTASIVVVPVASVASAKPAESKPGMQLIDSYEESTNHLNILKTSLEVPIQNNKDQKTTITKLHHSNEVKREIEAASPKQQLASVHHHPHQQQDLGEQSSSLDKSNESALDNSNVIYDNDGEHINLTYPTPETSSPPAITNGRDHSLGGHAIKQSDSGVQQDGSKPLKHLLMDAANSNKTVSSSSSTSSFVHREHADETQEPQDNYATCLLVEPVDNDIAHANNIISKFAGRLNFWQPIQNRGVAHLIARFRYEYNHLNQTNSNQTIAKESNQQLRHKRESFQTLIERAPPSMQNEHETLVTRPSQLIHQIWLHDDGDCTPTLNNTNQNGKQQRRLVAELKAMVVNGTIDIDSELIVGQWLNLAETNSIINKCLRMNLLLANTSTSAQNLDPPTAQQQQVNGERQHRSTELLVGHCKIVQSDNLPLVNELEQSPSVASNVQPLREDLLVSGSSLTPASASTTTKTAPSNRKALFELM